MLLYEREKAGIYSIDLGRDEEARYQVVPLGSLQKVMLLKGQWNPGVFPVLNRLSLVHLLPKQSRIGALVLFRPSLTEENRIRGPEHRKQAVVAPSVRAGRYLNAKAADGIITVNNGNLYSADQDAARLLNIMKAAGDLSVADTGKKGDILFVPVSDKFLFLSDYSRSGNIVFNSHFFLMDITDMETDYDAMGEPYGLLMIDGEIVIPPLYRRSALFLGKEGKSSISHVSIKDTEILIDGVIYKAGENCNLFVRPEYDRLPLMGGTSFVIVGNRIVSYSSNGNVSIPEAGYILHVNKNLTPESLDVGYSLPGKDGFGIQVGPPLVRCGKKVEKFEDPFFNGNGVRFPPTVYPQGWSTGKAARLGLGIKNGAPYLIWGEGSKAKFYRKGIDSPGFTLDEFASIGREQGFDDFINLDGGGSAQIAVDGSRMLKIADRDPDTGTEFERPVPAGLGLGLY